MIHENTDIQVEEKLPTQEQLAAAPAPAVAPAPIAKKPKASLIESGMALIASPSFKPYLAGFATYAVLDTLVDSLGYTGLLATTAAVAGGAYYGYKKVPAVKNAVDGAVEFVRPSNQGVTKHVM